MIQMRSPRVRADLSYPNPTGSRLVEWGNGTLVVLRRTAITDESTEADRATYVVAEPIDSLADRLTGGGQR